MGGFCLRKPCVSVPQLLRVKPVGSLWRPAQSSSPVPPLVRYHPSLDAVPPFHPDECCFLKIRYVTIPFRIVRPAAAGGSFFSFAASSGFQELEGKRGEEAWARRKALQSRCFRRWLRSRLDSQPAPLAAQPAAADPPSRNPFGNFHFFSSCARSRCRLLRPASFASFFLVAKAVNTSAV